LGPAIAEFQQRHPQLEVQLQLTEQLPDLAVEGFDGAVWLWAVRGQRASEWTGRRLARNQRVLVAAPAYLQRRGAPAAVEELSVHDCLVVHEHERFDVWRLQRERDRAEVRVRVGGPLSSNSGELVRDWCLAGHGIMLRSLWDIAAALATGELVRVLPAYAMTDADIHWLAPHTASTPKRIKLLVDFLAERFRGEPEAAGGWLPRRRTTRLPTAECHAATISAVIGSPNNQAISAVLKQQVRGWSPWRRRRADQGTAANCAQGRSSTDYSTALPPAAVQGAVDELTSALLRSSAASGSVTTRAAASRTRLWFARRK
jgi:hypothetical protein